MPAGALACLVVAGGCQSASQQLTGPGSDAKCRLSATTTLSEFGPEGGAARVSVETERDCTWEIRSDAPWLTVPERASGQGNGTIDFTVGITVDPVTRTASLHVGDEDIAIVQRGAACRYDLSPSAASMPAAGGNGAIDVVSSSVLCEWAARTDAAWITLQGAGPQRGGGRVAFQAAPSPGPSRRAEIVVGNRAFMVTQSGCEYQLDPATASFVPDGAEGQIRVSTTPACAWAATSEVNWIMVTGGATGTGPGRVQLSVATNTGPPRSGAVTIGNQRFTASQATGCRYSISPPGWFFVAAGAQGAIRVETTPGCAWIAVSSVDWMTITAGHAGTGAGEVWFAVAPNAAAERVGTLSIAGLAFRATQAAGN